MQEKQAIRKELRQRIAKNIGDSASLVRQLISFLTERPECQTVAIFAPLIGEVDLLPIVTKLERRWVFPKVHEGELVFFEVTQTEKDFVAGAYGIFEPKEELPIVPLEEIDLFVCPGLGFDRKGGRIGRGKGFYDITLSRAKADTLKVGVCFSCQILEEIVMENHDIRMNHVIVG